MTTLVVDDDTTVFDIVRGIVEAHTGLVTVCNVPGGRRFEVTLRKPVLDV